jgi:hypothetical protein
MTDAACISSTGVLNAGAPARVATSASPVASITRFARIDATGLGFDDDPDDRIAVHQRRYELPVQHGMDARLLDQRVGDQLEAFRIELVGQRLAFRHRRAHRLGPLLEFAADAVGLHRLLVPVPGETFDTDHGDVAAEAAEALDQRHLNPGPRGGQRRGETTGTRTDHEHVGMADHLDPAGGFGDIGGNGRHDLSLWNAMLTHPIVLHRKGDRRQRHKLADLPRPSTLAQAAEVIFTNYRRIEN